ncbi:MAG: 60S ribosomal export protein NMD3 [Thermoplasmatota archaeon]
MFCVECGKKPDKLYNDLCKECFLEKEVDADIKSPIAIKICSGCGSVKKGNKWIERPDIYSIMLERIDDAIEISPGVDRYSFQVDFEEEDANNIKADVEVSLLAEDLKTKKKLKTKIIFQKEQCDICSRIHGSYYEAILQVRPTNSEMTEEQKNIVREKVRKKIEVKHNEERSVFLTFEEEIHGGLDFYLSDKGVTKNLAKEISNRFGGKITTSGELAGREDGRDVYRMTYSVRLPPYEKGDFVELDKKIYKVRKVRGGEGKTTLENLQSGKRLNKDNMGMEQSKVVGDEDLIEEAVIVSENEKEIKILDPEDYKTITLVKPEGFSSSGEKVKVIRVRGKLHIVTDRDDR